MSLFESQKTLGKILNKLQSLSEEEKVLQTFNQRFTALYFFIRELRAFVFTLGCIAEEREFREKLPMNEIRDRLLHFLKNFDVNEMVESADFLELHHYKIAHLIEVTNPIDFGKDKTAQKAADRT